LKATPLIDSASVTTMTPSSGVYSQVSSLADIAYTMDPKTMNRGIRHDWSAMTTHAEHLLFELN